MYQKKLVCVFFTFLMWSQFLIPAEILPVSAENSPVCTVSEHADGPFSMEIMEENPESSGTLPAEAENESAPRPDVKEKSDENNSLIPVLLALGGLLLSALGYLLYRRKHK